MELVIMNLALTLLLTCFETYYNNHVNYKTYKDHPPQHLQFNSGSFFFVFKFKDVGNETPASESIII